jgi:hypothetical protein
MLGGEKVVTSIIKIIKAEREAKKNNHGKGVGYNRWMTIAQEATLPKWMTVDLNKKKRNKEEKEELIREYKEVADERYKRVVGAKMRARIDNEKRGGY